MKIPLTKYDISLHQEWWEHRPILRLGKRVRSPWTGEDIYINRADLHLPRISTIRARVAEMLFRLRVKLGYGPKLLAAHELPESQEAVREWCEKLCTDPTLALGEINYRLKSVMANTESEIKPAYDEGTASSGELLAVRPSITPGDKEKVK